MKKIVVFFFVFIFTASACVSSVCGVALYPEDSFTVFPVAEGGEIAARINTSVPFCGFELKTGESSENGLVLTLSVYSYSGSYSGTVSSQPVAQAEFSEVQAGQWLYLQTREMPAGEYLLVANVKSAGATFDKTAGRSDLVDFYYAQSPLPEGAFLFRLIYKADKAEGAVLSQLLTSSSAQSSGE